jgi:toxin HigB-1
MQHHRPYSICIIDWYADLDSRIIKWYIFSVIRSFRDKATEAVFNGESPKGFPTDLVKVARRKLRYLNAAGDLGDLRSPPGNRLETLAGDRKGQHSIRVNDQFRVCFVWTAEGPVEVEIVDYH